MHISTLLQQYYSTYDLSTIAYSQRQEDCSLCKGFISTEAQRSGKTSLHIHSGSVYAFQLRDGETESAPVCDG